MQSVAREEAGQQAGSGSPGAGATPQGLAPFDSPADVVDELAHALGELLALRAENRAPSPASAPTSSSRRSRKSRGALTSVAARQEKSAVAAGVELDEVSAAALGLVQVGTSGDCAKPLGNLSAEQWERSRVVDALLQDWRTERREQFERIAARARRLHAIDPRQGYDTRAAWYEARARGLSVPWTERAEGCQQERELFVSCNACGAVHSRPLTCELRHWCPHCSLARSRKEFARLRRALDARKRQERARWFRSGKPRKKAPQIRILTLTVRDGDADLEVARKRIERGWPLLRRWLHEECGYAPPYSATWEVTAGSSSRGHPHLHICAVLPFLDLERMTAQWERATSGFGARQGLDLTTVTPTGGAKYVSAYVTAGALDDELPEEVAAAWTRASYARRLVHASVRFWLPLEKRPCADCGDTSPQTCMVKQTDRRAAYKPTIRPPPVTAPPSLSLH